MSYSYSFDERVLFIDLIRLKRNFPDRDSYDEMLRRLRETVNDICNNPDIGEKMERPLQNWRRHKWSSGPTPNSDPWPDMRIVYSVNNEGYHIRIFAIGKRIPNSPDDIYRLVGQRQKS